MLSQHKKDYFSFETFRTNLTITTKINLEQRHEKEETEKNIIENCQTKMVDRNTRKKKKRRNRATRKQKIKWQY